MVLVKTHSDDTVQLGCIFYSNIVAQSNGSLHTVIGYCYIITVTSCERRNQIKMSSCSQGLGAAGGTAVSTLCTLALHVSLLFFLLLLFPFILTDVTFRPCPSRKTVTQVSTDQVTTRAGVDAYTHFTLIGV